MLCLGFLLHYEKKTSNILNLAMPPYFLLLHKNCYLPFQMTICTMYYMNNSGNIQLKEINIHRAVLTVM